MRIIYEDNHLLIVEKPQNMPTQADASGDPDLLNACKAYIKEQYGKPGEVYLGLVHRLDRPAGGVMAFARTSKAAARLSQQLQSRRMSRTYCAVVQGQTPDQGRLEDWLLKDESTNISRVSSGNIPGAKLAKLSYRTLSRSTDCSLVEVHLETGRSHQIRVQFSHAGHPLLHDQKYDPKATPGNLALWACSLTLDHPTKKEPVTFTAPLPDADPWNRFQL